MQHVRGCHLLAATAQPAAPRGLGAALGALPHPRCQRSTPLGATGVHDLPMRCMKSHGSLNLALSNEKWCWTHGFTVWVQSCQWNINLMQDSSCVESQLAEGRHSMGDAILNASHVVDQEMCTSRSLSDGGESPLETAERSDKSGQDCAS